MREIETELLARVLQNVQSVQNENAPSVEIIVSRANTPILRPEYWQESIVTEDATATCTSVAVKKIGRKITDVYVSYVADGTLTVKRAKFLLPVTRMVWNTVETVEGAVECAIEFDGTFRRIDRDIEYRTEDVPWIFYTTTAGMLMYGHVGDETFDTLIASNVGAIDVVKGVEGQYGEISQGLIVFYIVSGGVFYRQLIDGEWQGQESVSIAPINAVSVKAERLFDFRIVLHVTDTTGALWEVISKMEASGWNGIENIAVTLSQKNSVTAIVYPIGCGYEFLPAAISQDNKILYAFSPVMITAENINNGEGNYGYKVRVTFDERIFDPMCGFILTDEASGAWSCSSAIKISDKVLELTFGNFNNADGDCTVTYTPGTIMGDVVPLEAGAVVFSPTNLIPFAVDAPKVVTITNIEDWSGSI